MPVQRDTSTQILHKKKKTKQNKIKNLIVFTVGLKMQQYGIDLAAKRIETFAIQKTENESSPLNMFRQLLHRH